jgi:hypothetical protein
MEKLFTTSVFTVLITGYPYKNSITNDQETIIVSGNNANNCMGLKPEDIHIKTA